MKTNARVRFRKQERIIRSASERIVSSLTGDQKRVLNLAANGYEPGEIARELAIDGDYVSHFLNGLTQRLLHDHVIISADWKHVVEWADAEGMID